MVSLALKRHISFQNQNNRKATHIFALGPIIFKELFTRFKNHYVVAKALHGRKTVTW